MFTGLHAILYSKDAERLRTFFRDVLEWKHVDAGHGWLIFALYWCACQWLGPHFPALAWLPLRWCAMLLRKTRASAARA